MMLRVVLVGWSEADWRLYRQPQWMAEVRRDPRASLLPRHHFDLNESAFEQALDAWKQHQGQLTLDAARTLLEGLGAVEIRSQLERPGGIAGL